MNKIKSTYDEMNDQVSKILGKQDKGFSFSMFDSVEDESDDEKDIWVVKHPDWNEVFVEGDCIFQETGWRGIVQKHYNPKCKLYFSKMIKNPTWKDVIKCGNRAAHGDHRFLEGIRLIKEEDCIKYYEFDFGS